MSTTLAEAREAIYATFVSAMSAQDFDLTLDNEDFKPAVNRPWIRFVVRHTASTQETLGRTGRRRFARFGSAFAQIFTPINSGTDTMDTLAVASREAFEGLALTGTTVRFLDVIVREQGVEGKWQRCTVEARFEYDETR